MNVGVMSLNNVRESRIGIDQSGLNVEGCHLVQAVPMNYMLNCITRRFNISDPFQLQRCLGSFVKIGASRPRTADGDMAKNAVRLPFPT